MELPVGLGCRLCSILSRFCGGTSRCKGQNKADGQEQCQNSFNAHNYLLFYLHLAGVGESAA